ncbi:btaf1 RNA polymerase II, B-TFIID transcription factor-associated, 170kDa, partial [Dionaea muscipula]
MQAIFSRDLFRKKPISYFFSGLSKQVLPARDSDGSVETEKRLEIVKAFNSDPTIDALLLTTH